MQKVQQDQEEIEQVEIDAQSIDTTSGLVVILKPNGLIEFRNRPQKDMRPSVEDIQGVGGINIFQHPARRDCYASRRTKAWTYL